MKHFFPPRLVLILIPLLSLVMHFRIFTLDLVGIHVWRQTLTQTVINNFYSDEDNILNPKINDYAWNERLYRMNFPIMEWLFAKLYYILGNEIYITRILSFIIGIGSVFGMFVLVKNIFHNEIIAAIAAWSFNFSPVFYYYTVNPMPDNFALCCSIWSVCFFMKWMKKERIVFLIPGAILLMLSVLSKLPFVLFGVPMLAFVLSKNDNNASWLNRKNITALFFLLIFLVPAVLWYFWVVPSWRGNPIVKGILNLSFDSRSLATIYYKTLISTLPELIINYGSLLFFFGGFYFLLKNRIHRHPDFLVFMAWSAALLFYFIYESPAIGTVHDYYLFPFLPLIFILVSYGAAKIIYFGNRILKYIAIVALMILPLTAYLRADTRWNPASPGFISDFYKYKNELRSAVPKGAICIAGKDVSHCILLYYINKRGWTCNDANLSKENLAHWIAGGAKYLYAGERFDTLKWVKERIKEKVAIHGAVGVYRLE